MRFGCSVRQMIDLPVDYPQQAIILIEGERSKKRSICTSIMSEIIELIDENDTSDKSVGLMKKFKGECNET